MKLIDGFNLPREAIPRNGSNKTVGWKVMHNQDSVDDVHGRSPRERFSEARPVQRYGNNGPAPARHLKCVQSPRETCPALA